MSGSWKGLNGYWSHFTSDNSPLPVNSVSGLFVAGKQNQIWMDVWISHGIGVPAEKYSLFLTDGTNWSEYKLGERGLPVGTIEHMVTDSHNRVWLSVLQVGICCFDGQSATVYEPGQAGLPKEDMLVTDLCVDELDQVWVATFLHGAYRLSNNVWEKVAGAEKEALSNHVSTFGVDRENHLWLACKDSKETRFLSSRSGTWSLVCSYPLGFTHKDEVVCFTVDRNENMWVGRRWGGLVFGDDQGWHRLTKRDCSLLYGEIQSLTIDEFDNLWVGTAGGFAIFDGMSWHDWGAFRPGSTEQPVGRKDLLRVTSEIASDYVFIGSYVVVDSVGRKWVCTPTGIAMFSPQDRQR